MKTLPPIAVGAIGLTALIAAGLLGPCVRKERPGQGPGVTMVAPQNASPLTVFTTVALGGFRGLAIDVLWARICILQDKGEYVEIAQLADWITKLDPGLPSVWDYHSFNLAYNISAMSSSPQDRWRWICEGLRMLRDEAIVHNPHEAVLYDRLCRIYKHKMVDPVDPGRLYYRDCLAKEMTALLGGAHPDYVTLMINEQSAQRPLDGCKLVPAVMMKVDNDYGPLDWRRPEAHMLHWAACGIKQSEGNNCKSLDIIICEAMREVFLHGCSVEFQPSADNLTTDVCDELLRKTLAAFETAAAKNGLSLEKEEDLGGVYRQLLRSAMVLLVDRGRNELAQKVLSQLRDRLHDPSSNLPLQDYVMSIRTTHQDISPTAQ